MNEINLLRFHDRSAREIHMLLAGELADEFFSRVVQVGKSKSKTKVSGKKHPALTFFFTLLLAMLCALGASYFIYYKYIAKTPIDIRHNLIPQPIRQVVNMPQKPVVQTKPDPYVINGYSNVGDLELGGTPGTGMHDTIITSEYKKPSANSVAPKPEETIKPLAVAGEPTKRIPDQQAQEPQFMPVYSGTYSIQFFNSDIQDTDNVKALAAKNDMKITKLAERSRMVTNWNAYYIDKTSKTRIAGYGVKYIQSFGTRAEAKAFLKSKGIRGFVAAITSPEPIYDWDVCCAKQDVAQKLAGASGVDASKVKIVKIKE